MNALIESLGWTLIHFLWQASIVAALLWVAFRLVRSARRRYLLAGGALLVMLACAVVTASHEWQPPVSENEVTIQQTKPEMAAEAAPAIEKKTPAADVPPSEPSATQAGAATPATAPAAASQAAEGASTGFRDYLPWVVALWAAGVVALSIRFLRSWLKLRRLRNGASPITDAATGTVFAQLLNKLGLRRPVALLSTTEALVPMVVGWLRPAIIVPTALFSRLPAWQVEAILAHELAHVRRHDYLVNLLQNVVETIFFYHPAVWWVSGQLRKEREHCCDDAAAATCGGAIEYARALTALEEMRVEVPAGALSAAGGSLLGRIRRLLGVPVRDARSVFSWPLGLAVTLLAAGLLISTHFVQGAEEQESDTLPDAPAHNLTESLLERWQQLEEKDPTNRSSDPMTIHLSLDSNGETFRILTGKSRPLAELEQALVDAAAKKREDWKRWYPDEPPADAHATIYAPQTLEFAAVEAALKACQAAGVGPKIAPQEDLRLDPGLDPPLEDTATEINAPGEYRIYDNSSAIVTSKQDGDELRNALEIRVKNDEGKLVTGTCALPYGKNTWALRIEQDRQREGRLIVTILSKWGAMGFGFWSDNLDLGFSESHANWQVTANDLAAGKKPQFTDDGIWTWATRQMPEIQSEAAYASQPEFEIRLLPKEGEQPELTRPTHWQSGGGYQRMGHFAQLGQRLLRGDELEMTGMASLGIAHCMFKVREPSQAEFDKLTKKFAGRKAAVVWNGMVTDSFELREGMKMIFSTVAGMERFHLPAYLGRSFDEWDKFLARCTADDREILKAIGYGKDDIAIPDDALPLLLALIESGKPATKCRAFGTLRKLKSPNDTVLDTLIGMLGDPHSGSRDRAGYRLGDFRDRSDYTVPRLIPLLQKEGIEQSAAAFALGRIGAAAKEALPTLEALRPGAAEPLMKVIDSAIKNIRDNVSQADADAEIDGILIFVADADTDKPIEDFRVLAGVPSSVSRQFETEHDTSVINWQAHTIELGKDGEFTWPGARGYAKMSLRIEADGYVPQVIHGLAKGMEKVFNLEFERDPGIAGSVMTPGGARAAHDATVMLAMIRRNARLKGSTFPELVIGKGDTLRDQWQRPTVVKPDGQGKFSLPSEPDPTAVVLILHNDGVFVQPFTEWKKAPDVILEKWGRIHGKVRWGKKMIGAGEKVDLIINRGDAYGYPDIIAQYDNTVADEKGQFVFERVLPGMVQLSCPIEVTDTEGNKFSSYPQGRSTHAEIEVPHTSVVIGGEGRTVTGRLVGFDPLDEITFHLHPNAPHFGRPGDEQMWAAFAAFKKSPAGAAYFREGLKINVDGSFELEGMLPGHYQIFFKKKGGKGNLASGNFHVPKEDPETENEPFDAGEFRAR